MGKIIVIGSQKGGVGKTTTTLNLAYSLKELGKKVLTVDFDSQANLTTCYGVEDTGVLEYTIGHLMMAQIEEEVTESFEDYIQSRDGVDYLPSSIYLSVVDAKLRTEMGAERMLAEVLEPLKSRYDYILIDTCPSLGMLTINALAAADEVIITVNPQLLAMMGLQDFLRIVGKIKKRINPKLEVAGILLTMCESRKDEHLLEFWRKVRNLDDDLTEYIVNHRYSTSLDSSVFDKKSADEIILCLNYDGLYGINNINRFLQENNKSKAYRWGLWTFKVGDPILFNESERFMPVLYNNLKGKIVDISLDEEEDCIWFSIKVEKEISEDEVWHTDLKLLESDEEGKSIVKFRVTRKKDSDDDKEFADDTDIPFQIAYAVSIHKAQGLEYDSVKVIITEEVDEMITHNIFYTAITRSKKHLKIYWSPETQEKVIGGFELADAKRDASIFKAQTGMKM